MAGDSPNAREKIDGLAAFTVAAFGLGLGLIGALDRVGAPDGFVQTLGPLLVFVSLAAIGLSTRSASLTDYLAARRLTPAFYGGLAFAGAASGIASAEILGAPGSPALWLALFGGLTLSALVVAPAVRGANGSSIGDVLATSYPSPATRVIFAGLQIGVGVLTAIAGFRLAAGEFASGVLAPLSLGVRATLGFVGAAVLLSLAPGGLKGAFWSDAASAGGALAIAGAGAAIALTVSPDPWGPLHAAAAQTQAALAWTDRNGIASIATAISISAFAPLMTPAIASSGSGSALRAGWNGLVACVIGAVAIDISLGYLTSVGGGSASEKAFVGAALALPILAISRAGVFTASRAVGLNLATAYSRLTVLSSRRIALIRLSMIATAAISLALLERTAPLQRPLDLALALQLAFVAPSLFLALLMPRRAGSGSALAALTTSAGLAAYIFVKAPPEDWEVAMIDALAAGAAGVLSGALVAIATPHRRAYISSPASDPFADLPIDNPR